MYFNPAVSFLVSVFNQFIHGFRDVYYDIVYKSKNVEITLLSIRSRMPNLAPLLKKEWVNTGWFVRKVEYYTTAVKNEWIR